MKTMKNISRYDGRRAADRGLKLTLFASALALVLHAWKNLKARPARSLCLWVFGGVLALTDLSLQILFPGADLHLEPKAIIEFVAKLAEWVWLKFETLHILQILFWMVLALATTRNEVPPEPPPVSAEASLHHKDEPRRRHRRRRKKRTNESKT